MESSTKSMDGLKSIARYQIANPSVGRFRRRRHEEPWPKVATKTSEWVVKGTPEGGAPFAYLGCDLWEFEGGKVTKKDTYWKIIG